MIKILYSKFLQSLHLFPLTKNPSFFDFLLYFQDTQIELVLLIFRRLVEDVHVFESDLPSKRKKEMSAALNENVTSIFAFLMQNLEVSIKSTIVVFRVCNNQDDV